MIRYTELMKGLVVDETINSYDVLSMNNKMIWCRVG